MDWLRFGKPNLSEKENKLKYYYIVLTNKSKRGWRLEKPEPHCIFITQCNQSAKKAKKSIR